MTAQRILLASGSVSHEIINPSEPLAHRLTGEAAELQHLVRRRLQT